MPAIAATTAPLLKVLSSDEATPVIARLVVVALVEVELVKSAFTKCEVDEAKMPFWAKSGEVVAAVSTP